MCVVLQQNGESANCVFDHCRVMRDVLEHLNVCTAGESCQGTSCSCDCDEIAFNIDTTSIESLVLSCIEMFMRFLAYFLESSRFQSYSITSYLVIWLSY